MQKFIHSAKELRKLQNLVICAAFGAISIILGSLSISIGNTLKIGFGSIPNQFIAALFGPVTAGIFAGTMDIVKFILHPTGPFFPGFTIDAILAGIIYGCFYYEPMKKGKKLSFCRILLAEAVVALFINILLATYWLSILYGKAFLVMLPARATKNVLVTPLNSILFYLIYNTLRRIIPAESFSASYR